MATQTTSKHTYRLVTVNKVPERARQLISQVVEALRDEFDIVHVANCESLSLFSIKSSFNKLSLRHIRNR